MCLEEEIQQQILERLLPIEPYKIILFGSYAYGTPGKDSDIDLYVVTNDPFIPGSWREKSEIHVKVARRIQDLMREYPIDLITHTRKMHEKFVMQNGSFAGKVLQKGIVLYEQDPHRMAKSGISLLPSSRESSVLCRGNLDGKIRVFPLRRSDKSALLKGRVLHCNASGPLFRARLPAHSRSPGGCGGPCRVSASPANTAEKSGKTDGIRSHVHRCTV